MKKSRLLSNNPNNIPTFINNSIILMLIFADNYLHTMTHATEYTINNIFFRKSKIIGKLLISDNILNYIEKNIQHIDSKHIVIDVDWYPFAELVQ